MNDKDHRPSVWVGHIAMYSKVVSSTCKFMQQIGMRLIVDKKDFALLELRGGTHLVITSDASSTMLGSAFDLMVDDIDASHAQFTALGLEPGAIERGKIHDCFTLREPGGTVITFNSSHVGDLPV